MHEVQSPSQLPLSIPRKTCRELRTFVWIRSSRRKAINRKAPEKCEDHFDAAGAIVSNRILVATLLLCGRISFVGTSTSVGTR